jgi:hypothetical protein
MNMDNKDLATVLWALRKVHGRLEREDLDGKILIEATAHLAHIIDYIEEHFENEEAA